MLPRAHSPRRPWLLGAALAVVLCVTPGCKKKKTPGDDPDAVKGDGVAKTLERDVPPFTSLHFGAILEGTYKIGAPHVALHGDANLLPHVQIETLPGHLWLKQDQTLKPAMKLTADVTGPQLTELIVDIASRLTVEGLRTERLRIRGAGAARLEAAGSADELVLDATHAAHLDLTRFAVRKAKVIASGGASVQLGYIEELDVETRGAARVSYMGDPKITRSEGRAPAKQK
jgi:hypothetical protein